jgi:hypothetical protein
MRTSVLAAITMLWGATFLAQQPVRDGDALLLDDGSAKLRHELEALHDRWFQAFDGGDGAAMDAMEVQPCAGHAGRERLEETWTTGRQTAQTRRGVQAKPERRDSAPVR